MERYGNMKQGKRTTRYQRELLSKNGFDWRDYLYYTEDDVAIGFVRKNTREIIWIAKG